MNQRAKVLLLIPHLGGGGAEKVIAHLAQGLPGHKYEVHLGLVTQSIDPAQSVAQQVAMHALGSTRVRTSALKLVALIWKVRPRLILSGMFHLNFLVLALRPLFPRGARVLVRQNSTVSSSLMSSKHAAFYRFLYRWLYRRADAVICQSSAMADDLAVEAGLDRARLLVLVNPVDTEAIRLASDRGRALWARSGPRLLAVGRLAREKGFDLLLGGFYSLLTKYPEAQLVIAGTGPEEASLRAQCRLLGLESAVLFPGHVEQPAVYFPGATAFVLSSRDEGMPNAMLEAAAGGLPIVALPASDGVAKLLRGRAGVWLTREISPAALGTALLEAVSTLRPGQRFVHSFMEPFQMECAIREYEEALDAAIATSRRTLESRYAKIQRSPD